MLVNNYFNLYLIRHGKSLVNETPDIIGQAPSVQLSETRIQTSRTFKE